MPTNTALAIRSSISASFQKARAANFKQAASYSQVIAARACAAIGLLLFNYVAARSFGIESVGQLITMISIQVGGGIAARLGLDVVLVRVASSARAAGEHKAAIDFYWAAVAVTAVWGCTLSAFINLFSVQLSPIVGLDPANLRLSALTIPLLSFIGLTGAMLRSSDKPATAQLFEIGGYSLICAAILTMANAFGIAISLSEILVASAVVSMAVALVLSVDFRNLPRMACILGGLQQLPPVLKEVAALWVLGLFQYAAQWAIVLICASKLGRLETAEFGVAQRFSMVLFLALGTVGSVLSPRYAALYSKKEFLAIKRSEQRVGVFLLVFAAPLAAFMLMEPGLLLRPFGINSDGAELCLRILVLGQCINLAGRCSSHILAVTRSSEALLITTVFGTVVGLAAALLLSAPLGNAGVATGQALAVAIPAICSSVTLAKKLRRESELSTTSLALAAEP